MRKVIRILIIIAIILFVWIIFVGYNWNWGPFRKLNHIKTGRIPGNAKEYDLENVAVKPDSVIAGKNIIFLGSSVTYGASSQEISFADYICRRNGCTMVKEAVSGTTLVDNGKNSYVSRLKTIDTEHADYFVCQLSTNDATKKMPLGEVSESENIEDFDTSTVAGAMEYIICYAKEKWNCPIAFYTNPKYESIEYEQMVDLLKQVAQKWDVTIINMWDDESFNLISDEQYDLYMADPIHPTKAGYLEWWTPYMEEVLENL